MSSAALAPVASFIVLAETATPAAAAASAAAPAASSQVAAAPAPRKICHRETPVGSNIAVTRCHNPDEDPSRDKVRDDVARLGGTGAMAAGNGFSKSN